MRELTSMYDPYSRLKVVMSDGGTTTGRYADAVAELHAVIALCRQRSKQPGMSNEAKKAMAEAIDKIESSIALLQSTAIGD